MWGTCWWTAYIKYKNFYNRGIKEIIAQKITTPPPKPNKKTKTKTTTIKKNWEGLEFLKNIFIREKNTIPNGHCPL